MRIHAGDRKWVWAEVVRSAKRPGDKWIGFVWKLVQAEQTGQWFTYAVCLKKRRAGRSTPTSPSRRSIPPSPSPGSTALLGIDVNASSFHLALAEGSSDRNLIAYERISLHEMIGESRNRREHLAWEAAYRMVRLALERKKAIAIEDLRRLPKGQRGDGLPKLRARFQEWAYRSLLEKIEALAHRQGIEVIRVDPAFTSVIGMLRYAPSS